ncbi:MAG: hypothetical protein ABJA34_09400 [Pseudonocardiales bacterium]
MSSRPGQVFVPRPAQTALRLPRDHVVSRAGLGLVGPPPGRGGLVLGLDEDRRPVPVRLFEGQPRSLAVVGSANLVRVIAFRAVAVGALIRVITSRPQAWQQLADSLGGYGRLVSVVASDTIAGAGSLAAPVLTVLDAAAGPPDPRRPPAPWGTTLTLLPAVSDSTASTLRFADLAVLARCDHAQARRACALLGVGPRHVPRLVNAPDDGLALVAGGEPTFLRLAPTEIERRLLGG